MDTGVREVIGVDQIQSIRVMFYREGLSKRQIAERTGLNWRTVAKYIESDGPWEMKRAERKRPVTGALREIVREILLKDKLSPSRKQTHTAKRIHDLLLEQGYSCSERSMRRLVASVREELSLAEKEAFLSLRFQYGQAAQGDWLKPWVKLKGKLTQVDVFAMQLCASRAWWAKAYPNQRMECFLDGNQGAFEYLDGVPALVIYDNLPTGVTLRRGERWENPEFVCFQAHFAFQSRYCTPAKGNEKGQIESLVKFLEQNVFTPIPEVESLEELNELIAAKMAKYLKEAYVPGSATRVEEALATERKYLLPLPARPYDVARVVQTNTGKYARVIFDGVKYSVPVAYAHRTVEVKGYPERVVVYHQGQVIAEHQRRYTKGEEVELLSHRVELLAKKQGALGQAKAVLASEAAQALQRFHEGLLKDSPAAARDMAYVLGLFKGHEHGLVAAALEEATARGCYSYDAVRCLLDGLESGGAKPEPLDLSEHPTLSQIKVRKPHLGAYDRLLAGQEVTQQ